MTKKILLLNGHPAEKSLSRYFSQHYRAAAEAAGHQVTEYHLADMVFDVDFGVSHYQDAKELEHDLQKFEQDLANADHFVLLFPIWWGGLPAKLKGLLDRALLPGKAFDPRILKMGVPTPLYTGKTGRVIMTSDTPNWILRWLYGQGIVKQVKSQILHFIGIKPAKFTHFSPAGDASEATIQTWVTQIRALGAEGA